MEKTLVELPLKMDAHAIAEKILEMFSEEDRTILRFGLLPTDKFEALERVLREKFETVGTQDGKNADLYYAVIGGKGCSWSLKKLTQEAIREVTLALYEIGNLVV